MLHKRRVRRPYQRKQISKSGILIFGIGLLALMTTVFIVSSAIIPDMQTKLDNLTYRARSYYRKLIPQPKFLPTPIVQTDLPIPQPEVGSFLLNAAAVHTDQSDTLPPANAVSQATPVALSAQAVQVTEEENLLLPQSIENEVDPVTGSEIQLTGFSHQWQTWNNCGPATITTYMSYFGA